MRDDSVVAFRVSHLPLMTTACYIMAYHCQEITALYPAKTISPRRRNVVKIHQLSEHTRSFVRHLRFPGKHIMPMYVKISTMQIDTIGTALKTVI